MYQVFVVLQVLIAVAIIALVLLQHGKGADAGAAFGSGASGTVFGSRGSANFLSRATAWLAGGFFVVSLVLAYMINDSHGGKSLVDAAATAPISKTIPAAVPETPITTAPVTAAPVSATAPAPVAESPVAAPTSAAPPVSAPTPAPAPAAAAPVAPAPAPAASQK